MGWKGSYLGRWVPAAALQHRVLTSDHTMRSSAKSIKRPEKRPPGSPGMTSQIQLKVWLLLLNFQAFHLERIPENHRRGPGRGRWPLGGPESESKEDRGLGAAGEAWAANSTGPGWVPLEGRVGLHEAPQGGRG
jgi:hypothetical protein